MNDSNLLPFSLNEPDGCTMNKETMFQRMMTVAAELKTQGLLQVCESDLTVHDRQAVKSYVGEFMWVVYDKGTCFFTATDFKTKRRNYDVAVYNLVREDKGRCYVGDTRNETLREVVSPAEELPEVFREWLHPSRAIAEQS